MKKIFLTLLTSIALMPNAFSRSTLSVVGTGDGIDLMRAIGHSYSGDEKNPDIQIPPSIGSGGGIGAVGSGSAVIGRVARSLKPEEKAHGLVYVPIAKIPTVIFVNKSLKITGLTTDQIVAIYKGEIRNWREVGGPDLKVRIVRREDSDSSLDALRKTMPGWKSLTMTERTKTAISTQEAIETVRDVPGTIGFGPFSSQLGASVTVVNINGISPLEATYPSSVELGLIYKNDTVTEEVQQFIGFAKSKKSQDLISAFGAVPVAK